MRPNFFNKPPPQPVFQPHLGPPRVPHAGDPGRLAVGQLGMYQGFEFCEADWLPPKDEYLHSEKYEIKDRDLDAPGHIKDDVRLINRSPPRQYRR